MAKTGRFCSLHIICMGNSAVISRLVPENYRVIGQKCEVGTVDQIKALPAVVKIGQQQIVLRNSCATSVGHKKRSADMHIRENVSSSRRFAHS